MALPRPPPQPLQARASQPGPPSPTQLLPRASLVAGREAVCPAPPCRSSVRLDSVCALSAARCGCSVLHALDLIPANEDSRNRSKCRPLLAIPTHIYLPIFQLSRALPPLLLTLASLATSASPRARGCRSAPPQPARTLQRKSAVMPRPHTSLPCPSTVPLTPHPGSEASPWRRTRRLASQAPCCQRGTARSLGAGR